MRMSAGASTPGWRGPGGGTEWVCSMVGAAVVPEEPGAVLDGFGSAELASPEHAAQSARTATAAVASQRASYPSHQPSLRQG